MKIRALILLALFLTLTADAEDSRADLLPDQESLFRMIRPEEAAHYVVLAPASLDFMKFLHEQTYYSTKGLINGVRSRQDDQDALNAFLARMEGVNEKVIKEEKQYRDDLSARLLPGDRLFFFRFQKEAYRDSGLLVIRDGQIVYRAASATAYQPGSELPNDDEVNFDRL